MSKQLNLLQGLIDKLSTRERVLVLLGILSVIYMLWDTFLIVPIQTVNNNLLNERTTIQKQIAALETRRILANGLLNNSKREQIFNEMSVVENKIKDIDNRILERLQGQVAPENMAGMLNDVLQNNKNLELISIHNEPAQAFSSESNAAKNNSKQGATQLPHDKKIEKTLVGIFEHSLELELQGRYLDILNYLEVLEELPWKIFWDQVKLDVLEYPNVKVKVKVHTFSLKDGWLSV